MIADTAFPANSPWLCDKEQNWDDLENHWDSFPWSLSDNEVHDFITKLNGEDIEDGADTDLISTLQPDVQLWQSSDDLDFLSSVTLGLLDEEDDEFHLQNHTHSVNNFLSGIEAAAKRSNATTSIQSGYSSGSDSCISVDENDTQKSDKRATSVCSTSLIAVKSHVESKKCKTKADAPSMKRRWSSMEFEEQQEVITELADIISMQLGVRERLEAIHIINPHCQVSPTDKDFLIDVEGITDQQFIALQKFVHGHTVNTSDLHGGNCNLNRHLRQQGRATPSKHCPGDLHRQNKNKSGRRKRAEQKTFQPMTKVARQRQKEKQSGYFLHEVWMTVSSSPKPGKEQDTDEHIDILE